GSRLSKANRVAELCPRAPHRLADVRDSQGVGDQAISDEAMRRIEARIEPPTPASCEAAVLVGLWTRSQLAERADVRVRVILTHGGHGRRRVDDGGPGCARMPDEPVVEEGPANGERRDVLVDAARKREVVDRVGATLAATARHLVDLGADVD